MSKQCYAEECVAVPGRQKAQRRPVFMPRNIGGPVQPTLCATEFTDWDIEEDYILFRADDQMLVVRLSAQSPSSHENA
jgi:hypothetical protein